MNEFKTLIEIELDLGILGIGYGFHFLKLSHFAFKLGKCFDEAYDQFFLGCEVIDGVANWSSEVNTTLSPLDPCHRHEPPLFWLPEAAAEPLPSWIEFRRFYIKVKVTVGPSEFLAAVGDASGSARDCGCSILLLLIELFGLPVAIKAVSAIAEVSRPAIEAAVGFGRRGMVLVTPLVYGFNF
ncbi:uncharacterized protein LOC107607410 [Arachis ipaensis]|uniref:uncharacterized protein LOC107607410 n=1 Tax=Arachis ipaensis TaxID=130454 RepID=UPI0007AF5BA0|nr:uncharacterized protein LOC107607410 [Arachis ipaensis]